MQAPIDNLTFEEWWAELGDAVRAWLLRRRVPPHLVEDIAQETGLRLFKMWDDIDPMRSPRGLAFTIASNLLWDERNRGAAREIPGTVPEESRADVERAGIARLELARVRRAMRRLSPQQRSVLLAEIGDADVPEASADAIKMMRMRARRKLTAILDTSPAGLFAFFGLPRRAWRVLRQANKSASFQLPAVAMVAACTTLAVVGIPAGQPAVTEAVDLAPVRPAAAHAAASVAFKAVNLRDGATDRSNASTRSDTVESLPAHSGEEVHVGVGEGTPVTGQATVSVEKSDTFEIVPPSCNVEPGETDVRVRCSTQVGETKAETDTVLGIKP